ncbi:hypothetical protein NQ176_g8666 [Zarea fungicola]|uniref:Uncharacterized protein n=1 Tax=Zarea fungicola TaxID=93591 RepID=A0ACC1MQZ6_9HYPO|nr:hypothetical protein NQ176_g8666 [Lecanicillium fungicola]
MYLAVRDDNISDLSRLLSADVSAAIPIKSINQLFHRACAAGRAEAAKLLLRKGVYIDSLDVDSNTPLCYAIMREDEAMVRFLVEQGASVGMTTHGDPGGTAYPDQNEVCSELQFRTCGVSTHLWPNLFYQAVSQGNQAIINILVRQIEASDAQDGNYIASLFTVVRDGRESIVRQLLDLGVNVEGCSCFSITPLTEAAKNGHVNIVRLLLGRSAQAEGRAGDSISPLTAAIQSGHESIVRMLLDSGATVEVSNSCFAAVLPVAIQRGHESISSLLLDRGAYPKGSGSFCLAPIPAAVHARSESILRLLLDHCVTLGAGQRASDGETHLQAAVDASNVTSVQNLSQEQGSTIHFEQVVIHQAYFGEKDYRMIEFLSKGLALPNRYILSVTCEQLLGMTASPRFTLSKC